MQLLWSCEILKSVGTLSLNLQWICPVVFDPIPEFCTIINFNNSPKTNDPSSKEQFLLMTLQSQFLKIPTGDTYCTLSDKKPRQNSQHLVSGNESSFFHTTSLQLPRFMKIGYMSSSIPASSMQTPTGDTLISVKFASHTASLQVRFKFEADRLTLDQFSESLIMDNKMLVRRRPTPENLIPLSCRFCHQRLWAEKVPARENLQQQKENILKIRDLPSPHWRELADMWICGCCEEGSHSHTLPAPTIQIMAKNSKNASYSVVPEEIHKTATSSPQSLPSAPTEHKKKQAAPNQTAANLTNPQTDKLKKDVSTKEMLNLEMKAKPNFVLVGAHHLLLHSQDLDLSAVQVQPAAERAKQKTPKNGFIEHLQTTFKQNEKEEVWDEVKCRTCLHTLGKRQRELSRNKDFDKKLENESLHFNFSLNKRALSTSPQIDQPQANIFQHFSLQSYVVDTMKEFFEEEKTFKFIFISTLNKPMIQVIVLQPQSVLFCNYFDGFRNTVQVCWRDCNKDFKKFQESVEKWKENNHKMEEIVLPEQECIEILNVLQKNSQVFGARQMNEMLISFFVQ